MRKKVTRKAVVKLAAPPARGTYNSSIDTLLYKVDKIEEVTGLSMSKIESMNKLLYEPEQGIYSRVKSVEKSNEIIPLLQESISIIKSDLKDLVTWKSKVSSISKWVFITLGGAGISLLFKLIYDFASGHIVIK
mgnify:FL=1